MKKLDPLGGAAFDPDREEPEEHETICYPGTRVDLIQRIKEWATGTEGKCIYWLQGMAGTGKSTVSRTVTRDLIRERHVVASFFFQRNTKEPDRVNPARLFPTIAAQLVRRLPSTSRHVQSAIDDADASLDVTKSPRKQQFEKLILGPLRKIDDDSKTPMTIVIVIDALDECDQNKSVEHILDVLPDVKQLMSIKVKFLVTSRPEGYICDAMDQCHVTDHREILPLHKEPMTKTDILVFVRSKLEEFRDDLNQKTSRKSQRLPAGWPGEDKITGLVKMAVPLFIFAATACRFIEDKRITGTPSERLERILRQETWDHKSQITATYLPALEQMVYQLTGVEKDRSIREFKTVVGPIVLLAKPLSANSLAALLGISIEIVDKRLDWLHSVLSIPSDPHDSITLFHLSFRDFLVDPEKSANKFYIDEKQVHQALAENCIQLMSKCFKPESGTDRPKALIDICDTSQPGTLVTKVDSKQVKQHLLPEMQYACLYWILHLQKNNSQLHDNDQVHCFLQKHLLHWLEALGWMGRVSESVHAITSLESFISVSNTSSIAKVLANSSTSLVIPQIFGALSTTRSDSSFTIDT